MYSKSNMEQEQTMKIFVAMPLGKKEIPALRPTIRKAVERGGFSCVFPDEIPGHGAIITDVMDAIAESAAVVVDISRSNSNVIWEYGWASGIGKPVFPISKTKKSFFFDTQHNRAIVYDPNDMEKTLGQSLTIWCEKLREGGAEFPPVHLVHSKKYSSMSSAVFGLNSVTDTEYGFFDLIKRSRYHFVAMAQNHYFLVTNVDRLKESIEKFFIDSSELRRFDIMMCDPADIHGVHAWISLSAPEYRNHLSNAATILEEVATWARSHRKIGDKFKLRKAPFVPVSINFVDPEERDGFLVFTPTFLKSESLGRHCMVISKLKNAHIFGQYWSWATSMFVWRDGQSVSV